MYDRNNTDSEIIKVQVSRQSGDYPMVEEILGDVRTEKLHRVHDNSEAELPEIGNEP